MIISFPVTAICKINWRRQRIASSGSSGKSFIADGIRNTVVCFHRDKIAWFDIISCILWTQYVIDTNTIAD